METSLFQKQLESKIGMKLRLRINDNHSTMLSVKWEPGAARVSLHRMFLTAPKEIMHDLAAYLQKKDKKIAPNLKAYIENTLQNLDYSHKIDPSTLETKGDFYDLSELYDSLNKEYFDNRLPLLITWFGKSNRRPKSRIVFGLYHDPLRLIKINKILDNPRFPKYLVSYVIYHEMLHHVCPAYVDETGYKHIHSKEFKKREKLFADFEKAEEWIKTNKESLFDIKPSKTTHFTI